MSITDELRAVAAKTECANGRCEKLYRGDLDHIAGRIDVEHERAIASVMNDALHRANEKDMAELGWIRLPKDADGVSIHVHDWIEVDDKKHLVDAIATNAVYWWEEDGCHWAQSCMCCHYQPDTWERIIEDAVRLGFTDPDNESLALKLVARCKALAKEDQ